MFKNSLNLFKIRSKFLKNPFFEFQEFLKSETSQRFANNSNKASFLPFSGQSFLLLWPFFLSTLGWKAASSPNEWRHFDLISCWKEATTLASVAHERPSQVLLNWLEALIRHQQLWWPPKLASASSYSKSSYFGIIWLRLSKLAHRFVPANGKMVSIFMWNLYSCQISNNKVDYFKKIYACTVVIFSLSS